MRRSDFGPAHAKASFLGDRNRAQLPGCKLAGPAGSDTSQIASNVPAQCMYRLEVERQNLIVWRFFIVEWH